ncbi:MAG: protein kinase [Thauera sp.]|nr:protein kinase [Thauera sp.]
MKIQILEPLGDGGFGDVWKARDELDRTVAVKIIREANEGVADALAHARALARAAHPNVVAVLTIERVEDPATKQEKDGVVMELLEGVTLEEHTTSGKLNVDQLRLLGTEIISGLKHIHAQGMTHGDLHTENIMVCHGHAKIIDILYLNTLALLSSGTRQARVKRDLISARLILQQLIVNSGLTASSATKFNNQLDGNSSIEDIENAFHAITAVDEPEQRVISIDHIYARLTEPDFVNTKQYAEALLEQIPSGAANNLLRKIADDGVYDYKHKNFISGIWPKLSANEKSEFLAHLSTIIDSQTPKGRWWPPIRILEAIGTSNWNNLSKLARIRIESLMIKDVLAGYKDAYGGRTQQGGSLGTYVVGFWQYFTDKAGLAANLISMLRQSWYTQNYIATHFMHIIPEIAEATGTRAEFIEAFAVAKRNDAKTVINNLKDLPQDWQDDIAQK